MFYTAVMLLGAAILLGLAWIQAARFKKLFDMFSKILLVVGMLLIIPYIGLNIYTALSVILIFVLVFIDSKFI